MVAKKQIEPGGKNFWLVVSLSRQFNLSSSALLLLSLSPSPPYVTPAYPGVYLDSPASELWPDLDWLQTPLEMRSITDYLVLTPLAQVLTTDLESLQVQVLHKIA